MARPKKNDRDGSMETQIVDAAAAQFAASGYHDASLSAIAASVGVRAPSLLYHFQSKERLYEAVVERFYQRLRDRLEAAAATQRDGPLPAVLVALKQLPAQDQDLLVTVVTELLSSGRGAGAIETSVEPLWNRLEHELRDAAGVPDEVPVRQVITLMVLAHVLSLGGQHVPHGVQRLYRTVWGEGDHTAQLTALLLRGLQGSKT